jgi:hypothetical protein
MPGKLPTRAARAEVNSPADPIRGYKILNFLINAGRIPEFSPFKNDYIRPKIYRFL